jgi:hypothetical protein
MRGRRLHGVVGVSAAALALACAPANGGLGGKCDLSPCASSPPSSFCQTIDDACDAELGAACVGIVATGGVCSRECMSDEDCRGAVVPMVCSGTCLRDVSVCLRVEDARTFCNRTTPPLSCAALQLPGDGVCDGPSGTKLCAADDADCGAPSPWEATCAASCADVRTRACPMDDLSRCEEFCVETVTEAPTCRREAKAYFECDLSAGALQCGANQKSRPTGVCEPLESAFTDCLGKASSSN